VQQSAGIAYAQVVLAAGSAEVAVTLVR